MSDKPTQEQLDTALVDCQQRQKRTRADIVRELRSLADAATRQANQLEAEQRHPDVFSSMNPSLVALVHRYDAEREMERLVAWVAGKLP